MTVKLTIFGLLVLLLALLAGCSSGESIPENAALTITGEVDSGKSTAVRYAQGHLHPSEYRSIGLHHGTIPANVEQPIHPSKQQLENHHVPAD